MLDKLAELAEVPGQTEESAERWAIGAIEAEIARLRAVERLAPHRVAHQVTVVEELVDTFDDNPRDESIVKHPKNGAPGKKRRETRHNERDDCPDCGRTLVAAADADLPLGVGHLLVCHRLHGMKIAGSFTDGDIVACGVA